MASEDVAPAAELASVRPGEELDWRSLESRVRAEITGLDGTMTVQQFMHGNANLTYLLQFGETELVMRRPPFGAVAPGAHDMRREHRVLSRLWQHYDRAPRALYFCDDHGVIGADFVVMERRSGEVVRDRIPSSMSDQGDAARRLGFAVVDALADLNRLDPTVCGLEELGRPAGFLQRQVDGWRERWERARVEGAPAMMDELATRLARRLPEPQRTSILHNDFKLDNCQFSRGAPDRVSAVFDWDMATLGDPLVDLGTLLNYWPDPEDPADSWRGSHPGAAAMGLPTRREIVDRYAGLTGLSTAGIAWYEAFAQWKTGIVVQQLNNRYTRGESHDPRMADIASGLPTLAEAADRILATLE